MKIGIIGSGNVGGTLGKARSWVGHQVVFGFRNVDDPQAKVLLGGTAASAEVATVRKAAESSTVIVLATPWEVTQDALASAGDLTGKILIDATNPLLPGLAVLSIGITAWAGEKVAEWARLSPNSPASWASSPLTRRRAAKVRG